MVRLVAGCMDRRWGRRWSLRVCPLVLRTLMCRSGAVGVSSVGAMVMRAGVRAIARPSMIRRTDRARRTSR